MWSQLVLCLIVGFACASSPSNPAWTRNTQYIYSIDARSFVGFGEISNHYRGFLLKAQLELRTRSDGNLDAKITDGKYAPVSAQLNQWDDYIPDVRYQRLALSDRPFQIELYNGVVRDIIVSRHITNWEANIIKSFVSNLQLDTNAENLIPSSINILPNKESPTGVYKTFEETVTGVAETLYEIRLLQPYILQTNPWLVSRALNDNDQVLEIVKTKNFTTSQHFPSYHFGLHGINGRETSNKVGEFLSRTSITWATVIGTLDDYTIQNSVNMEEIYLSPTFADKQKGSVHSFVNVTLVESRKQPQQNDNNVVNPIEVGIVYGYSNCYGENIPHLAKPYDHAEAPQGSAETSAEDQSLRSKRSIDSPRGNSLTDSLNYADSSSSDEDQVWYNEEPNLEDAPQAPLTPYNVGYNGQSLKKQQDIVNLVRKLSQQIAQEFEQLDQLPRNAVGKFVILTSLVRIMNYKEIQQVAGQVYNNQRSGVEAATWTAYSSAVAQAGTGPALAALKDWIYSGKLSESEAADAVSTAANSAREPTYRYMQLFYQMVQEPKIMQQQSLNESVLLSYTNLLYKVYGNKQNSHNTYPIHSFGSFYTQRGKDFVLQTVIPYLTKQLDKAIANGDTEHIHAYIRALGNIGRQQILKAFEPYLEGDKKSSHFQRFLMVLALDRLSENNKRVARSVLFKIYQNPSEYDQVRAAAVYGIMRTNPSPEMLQRMAEYTNVDTSSYVNSLVKSAIETASELEGEEHYELRQAALVAKPFLISEEYGTQYGDQILKSYVFEQMPYSEAYKENILTVGGEDSTLPRGYLYSLRGRFGGVKRQFVVMQAMFSSVEDLLAVTNQQTKEYQEAKIARQQSNPAQQQWTSEYVAKLLKMQNEQREQLEGYLYYRMESFQKIFSFDNQTVANLSEYISELEQELRQGQHYHHHQMSIAKEVAVALPTILGVPFIYTYDIPAFVRFEAQVKATASPQLSQGGYVQKPNTVQAEFDVKAVVSARVQSQLSILTPFDNQRYSAGYDKNIQFNIPLKGSLNLNVQNKQLQAEIQNPGSHQDVKLLHYSNIPYTGQNEVYNPTPEIKEIKSERPFRFNHVYGQKSTGLGFNVQLTTDELIDPTFFFENVKEGDFVAALLGPWQEANIHHIELNVGISSSKSSTEKVAFEMGYLKQYHPNKPDSPSYQKDPIYPKDIPAIPEGSEQRQQEFMAKALKDINNANGLVLDATVQFQGQQHLKYYATLATAKSNVDANGRLIAYVKKDDKQGQPMQIYTHVSAKFPNTNGVDLEYAVAMNPQSKLQIITFLRGKQRRSNFEAEAQLSKSQDRKEYLQQQPEYQESHDSYEQLPLVASLIAEANFLDQFSVSAKYKDLDPQVISAFYKAYSVLRYYLYPKIEENIVDHVPSSANRLEIEGQFNPSLQYLNFSVNSEYGRAEAKNLEISQWAKQLLVPHPVFHTKARLIGESLKLDTFRPICLINPSGASTFDNKTYPADLSNDWSILFQYVPRIPSSQPNQPDQTVLQQLQELLESYIVYVRDASPNSAQKEVKIVFQSHKTANKIFEIVIRPVSDVRPRILVNNQLIQINEQQAVDLYSGFVEMYGLPNNEVKVEIRDAFYIISDGEIVKLTAVNSKFKDASRGLCGTFTGEPETDFLTPGNCIIHDPEQFVESYTLNGKSPNPSPPVMGQPECIQKTVDFVDSISEIDVGELPPEIIDPEESCTKLQTQYVKQGYEVCFTIRPLPVCKRGCRATSYFTKNIPVHCVHESDSTDLWIQQICQGLSPDFSQKSETKSIKMELPYGCKR